MNILSILRLLANSQFLRLWISQIMVQIAINMTNYTVLLLLAYNTHNTLIQAQFYAVITIPAVLFGFIAGPAVEVLSRRKLLIFTTLSFSLLFLLYIFSGSNILFLFLVGFLVSSLARFFVPANAATIPAVVSEEFLEEANSLFLFTLLGSVLVGYVLSSPVIQLFGGLGMGGEKAPFIFASILSAIGLLLALSMKSIRKGTVVVPDGTLVKKSFLLFWETLHKVKSEHVLILALGALAFVELNIGILTVVFLEYVQKYLVLPVTMVTYVLVFPFIVGLLVGIFLLRPLEKRMGRIASVLLATATIGVLFVLFGVLPLIFTGSNSVGILRLCSIIAAFVAGIAIVLISVRARTILQTHAPLSMQGRVFSFVDILIALVTPLPILFLGYFAQRVSIITALDVYGICVIVLVLFLAKRWP